VCEVVRVYAENVELLILPISVRIFMASRACNEPIVPTTGPRMPASEQFDTVSGGGAFG
jgi:hypothetical protein